MSQCETLKAANAEFEEIVKASLVTAKAKLRHALRRTAPYDDQSIHLTGYEIIALDRALKEG